MAIRIDDYVPGEQIKQKIDTIIRDIRIRARREEFL